MSIFLRTDIAYTNPVPLFFPALKDATRIAQSGSEQRLRRAKCQKPRRATVRDVHVARYVYGGTTQLRKAAEGSAKLSLLAV
jgi:hypothetical protein